MASDDFTEASPPVALATHNSDWADAYTASPHQVANLQCVAGGYCQTNGNENFGGARNTASNAVKSVLVVDGGSTAGDTRFWLHTRNDGANLGYSVKLYGDATNWTGGVFYKDGVYQDDITFSGTYPRSSQHTFAWSSEPNGANRDILLTVDGVTEYSILDNSSPISRTGNPAFTIEPNAGGLENVITSWNDGESGVTLTDLDTDESITSDQENVALVGTGFEAAQGAGTVTLRNSGGTISVEQSIDSWADEAIQFDVVQGGLPYASDHVLRVTNDSAETGDLNSITLAPPSGKAFVDVVDPVTDNTSIFYQYTGDAPATGDQIEYETTTNLAGAVTVNADGTFSVDGGGESEQTFDARVWDATDNTWGSWQTITINGSSQSAGSGSATSAAKNMMMMQALLRR